MPTKNVKSCGCTVVKKCSNCPCFILNKKKTAFCELFGGFEKIHNFNSIPEWCPLPDYEDKPVTSATGPKTYQP